MTPGSAAGPAAARWARSTRSSVRPRAAPGHRGGPQPARSTRPRPRPAGLPRRRRAAVARLAAGLLRAYEAHPSARRRRARGLAFAVARDPVDRRRRLLPPARMPTGHRSPSLRRTTCCSISGRAPCRRPVRRAAGPAGGSDTLFTRPLVAAAGPLVWCDEAVVTDVVPAHRATRRWVLRRQLRSGNSWSRTALMLAPAAAERVTPRAARLMGAARVAGGAVRWLWGALFRRVAHRARGGRGPWPGGRAC